MPKLFKLANSKLLTLTCLAFPVEILIKALAFPLLLLPPEQIWCFPTWLCIAQVCPHLLGNLIKFFSQRHWPIYVISHLHKLTSYQCKQRWVVKCILKNLGGEKRSLNFTYTFYFRHHISLVWTTPLPFLIMQVYLVINPVSFHLPEKISFSSSPLNNFFRYRILAW